MDKDSCGKAKDHILESYSRLISARNVVQEKGTTADKGLLLPLILKVEKALADVNWELLLALEVETKTKVETKDQL